MRDKEMTRSFYQKIGFQSSFYDYEGYLMMQMDQIELHFFEFKDINPAENDGQVYIRTDQIEQLFQQFLEKEIAIHPNGKLESKPWKQKEFSVVDPDNNLLTFGESIA